VPSPRRGAVRSELPRPLAEHKLRRQVAGMSTDGPWAFGLAPLGQTARLAPLLRRVAGLALALDAEDPAVETLVAELHAAEELLMGRVPEDPTPRLGPDATDRQRPYVDHSRDIGAYDPCFPEYEIEVDGAQATGAVSFPLAFEGPPGLVHGGVLATFFDCVIQHHNCDVGVAGKTTSLLVEYRRPTPLNVTLAFDVEREADDRRIVSRASIRSGDEVLCAATMEAVAGDRRRLPQVGPRAESQ
jgi:acyl-coenzyme A thioesterase PaaI-like protein